MSVLHIGQQLGAGGGTTLVYATMPVDGEIYGIFVGLYSGDEATHSLQIGRDEAGGASINTAIKDNVIFYNSATSGSVETLNIWIPIHFKVSAGTQFTGTISGLAGSVYQATYSIYYD